MPRTIDIEAKGSPKITKVDSTKPDLIYGVGEEIYIDVTFTTPVEVYKTPQVKLTTGCHLASCVSKEVQGFTCLADEGKFTLTFRKQATSSDYDLQHIMNIPATADQEYLKQVRPHPHPTVPLPPLTPPPSTPPKSPQVLEQLDGINRVTIWYDDSDDRDYSFGRRVCTSKGNYVRITFDDVNETVGSDGDIPELTFDSLNAPLDPRTYLSQGDGTFLRAQLSGNTPSLSATATEVTKGVKYEDRLAIYHSGNGTDTIRFQYTIKAGDTSADLEADSLLIGSTTGYIYKADSSMTTLVDSANFPSNTERHRYVESRGSSLAFNRNIGVDTSTPTVTKVYPSPTQVDPGTYGVGEEIYLSADFSHNVTANYTSWATRPYLLLETGVTKRKAYCISSSGNTVNFLYTVRPGEPFHSSFYSSIHPHPSIHILTLIIMQETRRRTSTTPPGPPSSSPLEGTSDGLRPTRRLTSTPPSPFPPRRTLSRTSAVW